MKKVQLRAMREEDLDSVLVIERESYPSPWSRDNFLHELRYNRFAANWVLDQEGRIVGYACVWFLGPQLKINNITIHGTLRRKGLGRFLLAALLRRARAHGCAEAQLEVRPSNEAALGLYRKHGFRVVGRRKNYYRQEGEDALLMELDLSRTGGSVAGERSGGV